VSKKKPNRRSPNKKQQPRSIPEESLSDPRTMEQLMKDINRLLEGQEFDSIDEVNAFMNDLVASGRPIPTSAALSPLDKAQELIYETWETRSRTKRIKLARQALEISADCADAYNLLAQDLAETVAEARAFYEEGVRAGERALGPETFKEGKGHFWGILETRPYMRARQGLAGVLRLVGDQPQAVKHYQDMLRLNPNDNQGIRYLLAVLLLELGDDKALAALLKKYKDDYSATWHYSSALLAFRQEGKSDRANKLLKEALDYNPHVPGYLLGVEKLPDYLPPYISPGEEDEAISYVSDALGNWQDTPGVLDWLRDVQAGNSPSVKEDK